MKIDICFILICISLILAIGLGAYLLRMRNKKQIHYAFLSLIISLFIWSFGIFLLALSNFTNMVYVYLYFFGVCFVPVSIFFLGLIFAYTKIDFNRKHKLLFMFPIIDYIIIITNKYHNLFFVKYSHINASMEYGKYYFVHTIILYIYIFVGLSYLLYYSIKNSGFFSRQSLLIILGVCIPFMLNILENLNILILSIYATPIAFSFAIICWVFAIFKFDFLNVIPVALQKVVDLISDGFIVIDEEFKIIDYNKTFVKAIKGAIVINRKDSIVEIAASAKLFDIAQDNLENIIMRSVEKKKSFSFEQHMVKEGFDKHFTIEITPIFNNDKHIGTIILLKDITQHKLDIEIINQAQGQLVESERLASLGQFVGGIAHNLKTPIMSIAGGLEAIEELAAEVEEDTAAGTLEKQDYIEIAKEIKEWIAKMKEHQAYMSDIITTVKGQAVQMNASSIEDFEIDELLKRVEILMKHELKKDYCTMNTDVLIDRRVKIKGEINNLVQILNNLITNAIQAYDEQGGVINFRVVKEKNNVKFIIKDAGKGIPKEIQEKLFNQMITTKGKNGTGLGLYISYSTIKGKFGGDMWFESEEGNGTEFYVVVPLQGWSGKREVRGTL